MIYYAKASVNGTFDRALELFAAHGIPSEEVILDNSVAPKSVGGILQRIKDELLSTKDSLVVDSVNSLGKNNREISNELHWFSENGITLLILNIPSTLGDVSPAIDTLAELYAGLAAIEIQNVKAKQRIGIEKARSNNTTFGRKRIAYPDNWDKYYTLWQQRKITVAEFMEATGLKKGTLYNLIKQYKAQKEIAKEA